MTTQKTTFVVFPQIHCPGTYLLSPRRTIIGTSGLNCSVRNGKRCFPTVKAPGHYIRRIFLLAPRFTRGVVSKFLNRNRNISTSRLHALPRFHLKPINVIISHGSITIPNLEAGFPLRCFQRLSIPDIATLQCPWQDSRYTRGQFTPVLSSHNSPISRSADYIFIRLG